MGELELAPSIEEVEVAEPSRFRQLMGRLALVGVLIGGAGAAGIYSAGEAATPTGHGEHVTAPLRYAAHNEPQLSVNDETRMRHNTEVTAELHHKEAVWAFVVWTNAYTPRINYNPRLWYSLHDCEQPNTWHAGGHFGNGLESGGDGLGMSIDAWRMAVQDAAKQGVTLPPTGWTASIDQQMQAAQVFLKDQGWGWGCHV